MIVLVGGEKGAVGKTTLAVSLAAMRRRAGHDALLLDADKQARRESMGRIRQEESRDAPMPCLQKRGRGLAADIRDLAPRYGDVVIDVGRQDSGELRAALRIADLALFPIQPALFDAATLETLAELVEQAQTFNADRGRCPQPCLPESPGERSRGGERAACRIPRFGPAGGPDPRLDHLSQSRLKRAVRREFKDRDQAAAAEVSTLYREVFGDG